MKKLSVILIVFGLIVATLLAIYFLSDQKVETIHTELISINRKEFLLPNDTARGSINIEINIEIPVHHQNSELHDRINKQVLFRLFGKLAETHSPDTLLKQFADEMVEEYISNNREIVGKLRPSNRLVFNNTFFMEGFSLLNDGKIFSYGISREVDLGGSFPANTRYYYNFDMNTGGIITEKDIFLEDFEPELTEIIRKRIIEESQVNDDLPTISSLEKTQYIIEAIKPNGNFYLNDEAICFVYNPYEIAPIKFMQGAEISLDFMAIKHLMKIDSPVYYLVLQYEKNNK